MLKIIRYILWALVLLGASFLLVHYKNDTVNETRQQTKPQLGGEFTLNTSEGKELTNKDLLGKPYLLFFGFTHCPDVCPTTLLETSEWLKTLGKEADKLNVVFVSVDPERDTIEQLKLYKSSFDPRIIAATNSIEKINAMISNFKAYYKKVPQGDSYTVDHTSLIFMMDKKGQFFGTIDYHEKRENALPKLKRLIEGK